MHDRSITIRLPMDILHRLEARLERTKASPTRDANAPTNISAAVRHVLKVGLDVMDGDGDELEGWFGQIFEQKLLAMVALAATDPDAARLLKKIAERAPADSDFG